MVVFLSNLIAKHGVNSIEALQGMMADLRSDTVTQPTAEMREVMKQAEVGDDVLGDDPTVNALQEKMAAMLGKQAALFVPSGTMSNAVAIKSQTKPGDEIVTHRKSHIYMYEAGGYAVLAGCSISLVEGEMGDAVGIVDMTGEQVAIPARKGLIFFPMIAIKKAWRVG